MLDIFKLAEERTVIKIEKKWDNRGRFSIMLPGMRAHVIKAVAQPEYEQIRVTVDQEPFEAFNMAVEVPTVTAGGRPISLHDSGNYTPTPTLFFPMDYQDLISLVPSELVTLSSNRPAEGYGYLGWLEEEVLRLRNQLMRPEEA